MIDGYNTNGQKILPWYNQQNKDLLYQNTDKQKKEFQGE